MKISAPVRRLFVEAHRRLSIKGVVLPCGGHWIGLGTEAQYRPAINAGLMVFFDGQTPAPRNLGWLVFTQKGLNLYNEMKGDFPA